MKKIMLILSLLCCQQIAMAGNPVRVIPPEDPNDKNVITVTKATYGFPPAGGSCDATGTISVYCNKMQECHILADNDLCGDPAKKSIKTLVVDYKCNKKDSTAKAVEGGVAILSCKK